MERALEATWVGAEMEVGKTARVGVAKAVGTTAREAVTRARAEVEMVVAVGTAAVARATAGEGTEALMAAHVSRSQSRASAAQSQSPVAPTTNRCPPSPPPRTGRTLHSPCRPQHLADESLSTSCCRARRHTQTRPPPLRPPNCYPETASSARRRPRREGGCRGRSIGRASRAARRR